MKSLPYILAAALLLAGCKSKTEETQQIDTIVSQQIVKGDLLFVGLPMNYLEDDMSSAIATATGDGDTNFIHTAIFDVDEQGKIWIIDATIKHGVDRYPLDTFLVDFTLPDGSYPYFQVMRLKDNSRAAQYVSNALRFVGEEYDASFLPDNGKHYCTELVYDAYVDDTVHRFAASPMNFKNKEGEFPSYWEKLFGAINSPIPQGLPGTNPQEMRQDSNLERVEVDITNVLNPIE